MPTTPKVNTMTRIRAALLVVICAISGVSAAMAQTKPGNRLADILTDSGCSIVIEADRNLWRDATSSDYQTSGWKAWIEQTKLATPWQSVGDFDGDGIPDVAKVVVRKSDGAWMMGVEFGNKPGSPCRRHQIASNTSGDGKRDVRLPGVVTLRARDSEVACNHVAERFPATCKIRPAQGAPKRVKDIIVMTDDIPLNTIGFEWRQVGDKLKLDGTPLLVFQSTPVELVGSMGGPTAPANPAKPPVASSVSPAEHAALVAEFDAAFNNADIKPHRSVMTLRKNDVVTSTLATELLPPDRMRTVSPGPKGVERTVLVVGTKTWVKLGGDAWQPSQQAPLPPTGLGATFGSSVIRSAKMSTERGVQLKTVELFEETDVGPVVELVTIDVAQNVPVRRVTTNEKDGTVDTISYDFNVQLAIEPPK
jgi:hypothetical protein